MTTYRVSGMTCEGCAKAVTKAIGAVAPAAQIAVDVAGDTVSVTDFDDALAIAGAVDGAGFDFGGVVEVP